MASQNIYDNETFYDKYSQFSIVKNGIEQSHEWSYIKILLPNINGLNVLDLGCGVGSFCREAIKQGAETVLGIDISNNMISKAIELNKECNETIKDLNLKLKYEIHDLESPQLNDNHFDLIYSRFVFHYIVNLESLFNSIYTSLKCGGTFIFIVEHPFKTSPISFSNLVPLTDDKGEVKNIWPLADYGEEGVRSKSWLGVDGIFKQHRKLSTYINTLIKCGFKINHIKEGAPTPNDINELDRLFILIIKVSK